jgi:hypothetical protein
MQRLVVLTGGGRGLCMLVLALTGVVDLTSRTGGSLFSQHTICVFLGLHLHGTSSCYLLRLSASCWLIGLSVSALVL